MRRRPASSSGGASGQSLVELALTVTVMMLLVAGAVDFGLAFFSYVAMRDAAQEGALYGSINPYIDQYVFNGKYDYGEPINEAGIRTRVRASSTSPVDFSNAAVVPDSYITAVATTGNACEGHKMISGVSTPNGVQVTVEYDYPVIMPFMGAIIGSQTIHLTATVADTILEPRCP
jgi:Flp pilus assembly protein TadG